MSNNTTSQKIYGLQSGNNSPKSATGELVGLGLDDIQKHNKLQVTTFNYSKYETGTDYGFFRINLTINNVKLPPSYLGQKANLPQFSLAIYVLKEDSRNAYNTMSYGNGNMKNGHKRKTGLNKYDYYQNLNYKWRFANKKNRLTRVYHNDKISSTDVDQLGTGNNHAKPYRLILNSRAPLTYNESKNTLSTGAVTTNGCKIANQLYKTMTLSEYSYIQNLILGLVLEITVGESKQLKLIKVFHEYPISIGI